MNGKENKNIEDVISEGKIISFLVERKFPHSETLPPAPSIHKSSNVGQVNDRIEMRASANKYRKVLATMTRGELLELYNIEWMSLEEERQKKEDNRFFNQQRSNADLKYWSKAAIWALDEAIALAFGKNPELVNWDDVKPYVEISHFAKEYKDLRNLAHRALAVNLLSDPIAPLDFLKWLKSIDFDLPELFLVMLQGIEEKVDAHKSDKINADISEIESEYSAGKAFNQNKEIKKICKPKKSNDWFDWVIYPAIKKFEEKNSYTPAAKELWSWMMSNLSEESEAEYNTSKRCFIMDGKRLEKDAFNGRYKRYYPNN